MNNRDYSGLETFFLRGPLPARPEQEEQILPKQVVKEDKKPGDGEDDDELDYKGFDPTQSKRFQAAGEVDSQPTQSN